MPKLLLNENIYWNVKGAENGKDDIGEYIVEGTFWKMFGTLHLKKTYIANSLGTNGQNQTENLGHNVNLYFKWSQSDDSFSGSYVVNTNKYFGTGRCWLHKNQYLNVNLETNYLGTKFDVVKLFLLGANIFACVFAYCYQKSYFSFEDYQMYIYIYSGGNFTIPDNYELYIANIALSVLIFAMYFFGAGFRNFADVCGIMHLLTTIANVVLSSIIAFVSLYSVNFIGNVDCEDYTNYNVVNGTYVYPTVIGTCKGSLNSDEIFAWFVKVLHDTSNKPDGEDKHECIAFSSSQFSFNPDTTYVVYPSLSCADIDNQFDNTMIVTGAIVCTFSLIPLMILLFKVRKMYNL